MKVIELKVKVVAYENISAENLGKAVHSMLYENDWFYDQTGPNVIKVNKISSKYIGVNESPTIKKDDDDSYEKWYDKAEQVIDED